MAEKPAEKKREVTHHIVYSTKGGCGKTAFSLFLTLCDSFQKGNGLDVLVHGENSNSGKHYLIDLDLLGSSLEYYLSINRALVIGNEIYNYTPTLQELVLGTKNTYEVKSLNTGSNCLQKHIQFKGCKECGINEEIYVIPVSASEKEKAMFHVKKGTTPLLRYEELEAQLNAIQQSILISPKSDQSDIHFVYDLAPNADSYTDAVISEIFNRVRKPKENEKDNEKVILYLVSNSQEMLNCNIDWLNRIECGNVSFPCSVILVNNNNVGEFEEYTEWGDSDASSTQSSSILSPVEDALNLCNCDKSVRDAIKTLFFFNFNSIPMAIFRYEEIPKESSFVDITVKDNRIDLDKDEQIKLSNRSNLLSSKFKTYVFKSMPPSNHQGKE